MSVSPTEASPAASTVSFRLKLFLRVLAVVFAVLQAWHGRHEIKPDGVSYLDIADAYLRADWHAAISTYWSPLYSWLLAAGLAAFRPSPLWEFAVAKVVNLAIFLAAVCAFEWFAGEATLPGRDNPEAARLPRGVLYAFAYGLFLWSSCVLTSVAVVSPDLLVSVFVYLLAAWVLRARRIAPGLGGSALFGLILGVGCLAKAALLPLGFLFVLASLFAVGSMRRATLHLGAAAVVTAVLVGGWVGAMHWKSGRITLGDVSRLNYLWIVNDVRDHGWESDDPHLGTAVHPPRRIPSDPPVYEFAEPNLGTFPLWYDPPHWCEGLTLQFDFRQQLAAVAGSMRSFYDLFSSDLLPFTAALALLHLGTLLASPGLWRALGRRVGALRPEYPLLIPSLGACAMYALVVMEPRYLTGFVVLLGMALMRIVQFPRESQCVTHRWSWAVVVVVVLAPTVWLALREGARGMGESASSGNISMQVAEELQQHGVHPGDVVGSIGSPFDAGWARAGRFRIGAEVRSSDVHAFWTADAARRERVLAAFRQAGATAIVTLDAPESERDWKRVAGTNYSFRILALADGAIDDSDF